MKWWIDKPLLLGSSNPSDADLRELAQDGFTVAISLLKESEQPPGYNVDSMAALGYRRHRFEISNGSSPSIDQLDEFIDLLGSLTDGTKVLVHCEGGCGRTGTFAAAYWIGKGLSAAEAIAKVRQSNPYAIETAEQERVLETFARDARETSRQALDIFAKLVALVYREVGVLNYKNHQEIASMRDLSLGFFATPQRKTMARELYCATRGGALDAILAAFEKRTGLQLTDVERAFREGDWRNSSGGYSYGGPKWAKVAAFTLSLRDAVRAHDLLRTKRLIHEVGALEHNNGNVVNKFRELDCP